MRLHHVQVSMPPGEEERARAFYRDTLGLVEAEKPPALAGRGGCWFRAYDGDAVTAEIHVSAEDPFTPAARAHPAVQVDDVAELEALAGRLAAAGSPVSWDDRDTVDGWTRFHTRDGFGNRVEVIAVTM